MPVGQGCDRPGAGVTDGITTGLAPGEESGVGPSELVSCAGLGFPIAINSETVANLKPFAASCSKVSGIALIVPG